MSSVLCFEGAVAIAQPRAAAISSRRCHKQQPAHIPCKVFARDPLPRAAPSIHIPHYDLPTPGSILL